MYKRIYIVVAAVAMVTLVCIELTAKPRRKQIPNGTWGGPNIQIVLRAARLLSSMTAPTVSSMGH